MLLKKGRDVFEFCFIRFVTGGAGYKPTNVLIEDSPDLKNPQK